MRPVRALREEHGIVPRPANTESRRHPAEGVLASCSPIFTCRDAKIATSPFVYRGSAISAPKNWGISSEDDAVFAKDEDDNVYRYSDEDEVPEDQEVIEADEAIHMLVTAWSDNDGEVSDEFTSSLDPWS